MGVTDAQAGLPAKGSGSAFPAQRVARGTSGSWSPAAGVPAAHSRRRVRGGLSPPSRAGNRAFGRTCPNAPVSGLPQPRGCERLRKVECSGCSGQRPETFIDTAPSGGVDSRPFPGIRKGFGCVALHRRIGGATGPPSSDCPVQPSWLGAVCTEFPRFAGRRSELRSRSARPEAFAADSPARTRCHHWRLYAACHGAGWRSPGCSPARVWCRPHPWSPSSGRSC